MANYYSPNIEINGCPEVHSVQAAMQYPIAPLVRIVLHDPTNNRLYLRSGSQTGLPPLIVYEEVKQQALPDTTVVEQNNQNSYNNPYTPQTYTEPVKETFEAHTEEYVTKTEYQNLINELFELRNEIRSMRNGAR